MAKNPDLYKKRYKSLKEHRAAVAARKALQGGKNKGPVANADAYGETLKKPKAKTKPIPKPASKPVTNPTSTTTSKPSKPSAQANTGTGRDGKFGTGTYGAGRKPDAKKSTKHAGGKRAQVNRKPKKDLAAGAREVSARARKMNPTPSSLPMSPAKNPKKGHRYKKPYGPIMIFNGTKYVPQ